MAEARRDAARAPPRPMRLAPAPRRLRILLVYSRLPLPMTRGDELTMAHLVEFLHARGHAVDLVTLDSGETLDPDHRAWLEQRCRLVVLPQSRARSALRAALGVPAGRPLQVGWFREPRQLAWVEAALAREGYDIAYAYYLRSAETLRGVARRPGRPATFLALQLSQYLNAQRLAATTRSRLERLVFGLEGRLLRAYEARIWRDFSRTVLIGPADLAAVREACRAEGVPPIDNAIFGPHGVDTGRFRPRPEIPVEPLSVVMTGAMRYPPNAQGALWLAQEVWPEVRAAEPGARLRLVGREPPAAVKALHGRDGISVTGTVEDVADWLAKAAVAVAPIRAAAGLQNKLLEAMAMGKAVVATTAANEGIGAAPGRDLLLADAPEAFARAILELLADPARAARLGAAARAFVAAGWTWEAHFLRLEAAFYAALDEARARDPGPARRAEPVAAQAALP
jgi:sugar transferase (PEP-CTERM/EpsH1 system associated)